MIALSTVMVMEHYLSAVVVMVALRPLWPSVCISMGRLCWWPWLSAPSSTRHRASLSQYFNVYRLDNN